MKTPPLSHAAAAAPRRSVPLRWTFTKSLALVGLATGVIAFGMDVVLTPGPTAMMKGVGGMIGFMLIGLLFGGAIDISLKIRRQSRIDEKKSHIPRH